MPDQPTILLYRCIEGVPPNFDLPQELANPKGLERSDLGRTQPAYDPGVEEQWHRVEKTITQCMIEVLPPPPLSTSIPH
jgi:hypothetical protein